MNTSALFLSAALAFFTGAWDAPSTPASAPVVETKPAAAKTVLQDAAPATEPEAAEALPEPEAVEAATVQDLTGEGADRAAAWFDSVRTLQARFEQVAPDGTRSAGTLSLQRPGRARFDYDDPSPVLLVADGSTVAIADFELETVDRAPIAATPLRFLLSDASALADAVTEAGRSQDKLYVTVVDPEGEVDGRLTLVFTDVDLDAPADTMTLDGWYALDAMGGLTEVELTDLERDASFDPRLFVLDDEDVVSGDRRRGRR